MDFWQSEWGANVSSNDKRARGVSGNVDGLLIHQRLQRYRITPNTKKPPPTSKLTHQDLRLTKDRRNTLAHGALAFSDMGKDLSVLELSDNARNVFKTLARIARHTNVYLLAQGYLKTSSWQRPF